ncbi:MAG TPA: hypothetical protein VEJ44_01775, partial [Acidimicrobiales bacterium]|nr:hypothetical protein [Acidimicrobiales bacterium]
MSSPSGAPAVPGATPVVTVGTLPTWAPRTAKTVLPAAAVVVLQLVAFPMPTGVVLQGVVVGLL